MPYATNRETLFPGSGANWLVSGNASPARPFRRMQCDINIRLLREKLIWKTMKRFQHGGHLGLSFSLSVFFPCLTLNLQFLRYFQEILYSDVFWTKDVFWVSKMIRIRPLFQHFLFNVFLNSCYYEQLRSGVGYLLAGFDPL